MKIEGRMQNAESTTHHSPLAGEGGSPLKMRTVPSRYLVGTYVTISRAVIGYILVMATRVVHWLALAFVQGHTFSVTYCNPQLSRHMAHGTIG